MTVRTVLGDIDPSQLGVTYLHEHLIIDSPLVERNWPHIHLHSVEAATEEATSCARVGVGAMVDAMPTGSGRDLARLAEVSRASGIHVVAATGMHTEKYYEGVPWAADEADALAERFVDEVKHGVDGVRAGIMKVATVAENLTARERDLFRAAGVVHRETGVAVLTHCEEGRGALAQLDMLESVGVPPERVILSHTDKVVDVDYHRSILGRGANVEYDQSLRRHLIGSEETVSLVARMWDEGFGSQIMLGTDGARRSLWTSLGGSPGLAWLYGSMPALLGTAGLSGAEIESMFVDNPARVLQLDR